MRDWITTTIGEFIDFNPSEKLQKNKIAKKIPMDKLGTFERKIKGFVFTEYQSGPKFRNNDTLVAKITPCLENGKTAFVNILDNEEVAFGSSEFIVLRNNKLSDAKFIYYLARSPYFREKAISCMEGTSGRKRVNETVLKHLKIKVPPIETQQKIAKILSDIDDKIEVLHQINDNLAELAKTIYDYWFVQFDFPDENGKPYKTSGGKMVYNEVLKREIPEGWEVKKIEDYCDIFTGKKDVNQSIDKGKYKFFSCSPKHRYSNDKLYEGKAILVSGNGSYTGRTIFVNCAFDLYQRTYACVPKDKKNNFIEYLYYSLCHFFVLRVSGGTHGSAIPYIVYNDIAQEYFLYNEKIIQKFMLHILPIQDKLNINIISMEELQSLRDWLLPMLMNGQISVE